MVGINLRQPQYGYTHNPMDYGVNAPVVPQLKPAQAGPSIPLQNDTNDIDWNKVKEMGGEAILGSQLSGAYSQFNKGNYGQAAGQLLGMSPTMTSFLSKIFGF